MRRRNALKENMKSQMLFAEDKMVVDAMIQNGESAGAITFVLATAHPPMNYETAARSTSSADHYQNYTRWRNRVRDYMSL